MFLESGAGVISITGGVASLVGAYMLGPRLDVH
jgi:ammonia channel protein AmtB